MSTVVEEGSEAKADEPKKPAVVITTKKTKATVKDEPAKSTPEAPERKLNKSQAIQQKMAKERREKIDAEKKKIEAEDKIKFKKADEESAKERAELAERVAATRKKDAAKARGEAKTKKQASDERRAESAARMAEKGKTKCAGSNLDVEAEKLKPSNPQVKVRENPWSKKGKRFRCPKCNRSVGIHVIGRKSEQKTPTGYKLNTHYVKVVDGKKVKVTAKTSKPTKRAGKKGRGKK